MSPLQRVIIFLNPALQIQPAWRRIWDETDQKAFSIGVHIGLMAIAVGQIGHIFFVDQPMHLAPAELWFKYRIGMSILAMIALLCVRSFAKRHNGFMVRVPYLAWGVVQSYFQALNLRWSDQVPFLFVLIVPWFIVLVARLSPLLSAVFLTVCYLCGLIYWPSNISPAVGVSGFIVGIVTIMVVRGRMQADVTAFIATQANYESQQKLIESQLELTDQVKAFLPKVLYARFLHLVQERHFSSLQAMDELTRVRRCFVTCLYSDIRGYTTLSKNSFDQIRERVIPNIRSCTDIIEEYEGVPKQVGDLVFGFFDEAPQVSIVQGTIAAMVTYFYNVTFNEANTDGEEIRRHLLISFGEVFEGNIGGGDNSREFTVMGTAANILSRIDSLTKEPVFQKHIPVNAVVFTPEAADILKNVAPALVDEIKSASLDEMGLSVRNFPEVKNLYHLSISKKNLEVLKDVLDRLKFLNEDQRSSEKRSA